MRINIVLIVTLFLLTGIVTLTGTAAASDHALPHNQSFTGDIDSWETFEDASYAEVDQTETIRLTEASQWEKGAAIYTNSISSNQGVTAEIRYYSDGGTGADGLTFFLLNDSQVDLDEFTFDGAGSLGYSGVPGISGGYLGIGFDEWGNFALNYDEIDEIEDIGDASGRNSQTVTVRGAGNDANFTNEESDPYPHIVTAEPQDGTIDGGWRWARMDVDPTVGNDQEIEITVEISFDERESWETVVERRITSNEIGSELPDRFLFGVSGTTGDRTNIHAVDQLNIASTEQDESIFVSVFFDNEETSQLVLLIGLGLIMGGSITVLALRRRSSPNQPSTKKETQTVENTATPRPAHNHTNIDFNYAEYNKKQKLSSSKFTTIWQATISDIDRPVALITLEKNRNDTIDQAVIDRFIQAVEAWAEIGDHEHILSVYDWGDTPVPWITTELADGPLDPAKFTDQTLQQKCNLLVEMCEAVHQGHRYGLVHGSLNQTNVLYINRDSPSIRISNWGITTEALEGVDHNQQSDVEAITKIIYTLMTGDTVSHQPSIDNILEASEEYPDELVPMFKKVWGEKSDYETVLHLRDDIQSMI